MALLDWLKVFAPILAFLLFLTSKLSTSKKIGILFVALLASFVIYQCTATLRFTTDPERENQLAEPQDETQSPTEGSLEVAIFHKDLLKVEFDYTQRISTLFWRDNNSEEYSQIKIAEINAHMGVQRIYHYFHPAREKHIFIIEQGNAEEFKSYLHIVNPVETGR